MKTFIIKGIEFIEGNSFTILTPELGEQQVSSKILNYSRGDILGLDLGWVKTPLPCAKGTVNAKLSLYINGHGYQSLQLAYFCTCSYNVHNHVLTWFDLTVQPDLIRADVLGYHLNQPHNHAVVSAYKHLKPKLLPPPVADRRGQFSLF